MWAREDISSSVWRNEFVKGMRGGLEFIENLWVGYCNPVQQLDELLVDGHVDPQFSTKIAQLVSYRLKISFRVVTHTVQFRYGEHVRTIVIHRWLGKD